jgi:hypothetical protein
MESTVTQIMSSPEQSPKPESGGACDENRDLTKRRGNEEPPKDVRNFFSGIGLQSEIR